MTKQLISLFLLASALFDAHAGTSVTYTTNVVRPLSKTVSQPTQLQVSTNAICDAFGISSTEALETAISKDQVHFYAINPSTDKVYDTFANSYGKGFWFTKSGVPTTSSNTSRRMACKYLDGYFQIVHFNDKVLDTDSYTFIEAFIHGTDTVKYKFNVTFGADESISCDQPPYEFRLNHRTDEVDSWPLQPLARQNDGAWLRQNYIQVMVGDKIAFSAEDKGDNTLYRVRYLKKDGKTSLRGYKNDPEFVLSESATTADAGYYICDVMYKDAKGTLRTSAGHRLYVDVQTAPLGTPFSWEGHVPMFSHDWKSDASYNNGVWTKPEKVHTIKKKDGTPANQYAGEWWSAFWGDNLNAEVGGQEKAMEAAKNMIAKYDDDFAYIRDYMGWPPDMSARDGYKSFVYIFGSGLANDNTSNTEKGGYQGNTRVDGKNYACVWASYYPFSRFRSDADKKWSDGDYQREAMIHEGIHAIFADLNHCNRSSWFHEAGNTWLQSAMNTERYNKYGEPGFLDACPFIAPFMPIECYSGWLQDGSFGGPQAEGVNMYNGSQQICTWRNLLGGTQYGNAFPIILGEICGKGSIPWIWRNCTDYVLKGIGTYLGEDVMRELIQQYRSRMATFDIGGWKPGYRNVTNGNFGVTVKPEWEPYWINVAPFKLTMYQGVTLNSADQWLAPDTLTNPGWSGCNIIPIHVDSKANTATIEFRPEDTEMRAQLCYTTKSGKNYYSQPVRCGKMQIDLTDRPANNVIFCVVCNTDYIYTGDAQRKHHYDYRIRFGEGALQVANLYTKWNLNEQTLTDPDYNEDEARAAQQTILTPIVKPQFSNNLVGENTRSVRLLTGNCLAGHPVTVQLADGITPADVTVNIYGLSGVIADSAPLEGNSFTLPSDLRPGLYFIKFIQHGKCDTYKVIIK